MSRYARLMNWAWFAWLLVSGMGRLAAADTAPRNEFFAMDTILYTWKTPNLVQEADVAKIAELGYAGLAPTVGGMGGWKGLPQLLKWVDAKKLKLHAVYTGGRVDRDKFTYDPGLRDALPLLKGRDTLVWLTIGAVGFKPSDPAGDTQAIVLVREVADLAAAQGLRVALYPHVNSLVERVGDAVRIAQKAGRKNVGVTLNLCHWLRAEGPASMAAVMKQSMPYLYVVSINGADRDGKNFIQPLDSGDFDVAAFLRQLKQLGYTGPIGLQGFGVGRKVPPYENLARSMAAWKRLTTLAAGPAPTPAGGMVPDEGNWQDLCARLVTYTHGQQNDTDLRGLERCLQAARPAELAQLEKTLVQLLYDAKVSIDAKKFICRQGSFFRSDEALRAMAQLQAKPELSFMACYGLARMPNAKVAATLQELVSKRAGRQRIDLINALGTLGDRQAVGLLARELANADPQIAAEAVVALGAIGGAEAEKKLAQFEPAASARLKLAVAESRLRCAASMPAPEAAVVYRQHLTHSSPPVRMAAFASLIGQQPQQRADLLLEAIGGSDPAVKTVAFQQARSGGGDTFSSALAALLPKLSSADQASLLDVLAQRRCPLALPAVLKLAASAEPAVRLAAFRALGQVGGSEEVDLLIQAAVREKDALQAAARAALASLRGQGVNERLISAARSGPPEIRVESIASLAARGTTSAVPLLLAGMDDREPRIQQEAITALRALADTKEFPQLLRRALVAPADANRQRLQELLVAVYRRSANPDACVGQLIAALPGATTDGKAVLLEILGSLGDPRGLEVLRTTLQSPDVELRKTALRALANWPDATPVDQLIGILRTDPPPAVQVLAVRTAVTLVVRDRAMANPRKAQLLGELLQRSSRTEEKRLVVGALPRAACPGSLQLAVKLLSEPNLGNEAAAAVAGMAPSAPRTGIPQAQIRAALEKAATVAKAPAVVNQVRLQLKALDQPPAR